MRKRDTSPLTSGPDRPAGPTRTTALQKSLHCELSAGISKTAALSASQLAAPRILHYTWCACRHRSRIGQVHRLPSGSDSHCVVREATLLTPLCAWLHRQGRGSARHSLFHADVSQDGTLMGGRRSAPEPGNDLRQVDSCLADPSQMEAVTCAREDGDPCLSTASSRRREVGLARRAAAAEAQAVTADAFLSMCWRAEETIAGDTDSESVSHVIPSQSLR